MDDFKTNINCGIGVLHVKRQILTYFFCDVISLLAQICIVSVDRAYKEARSEHGDAPDDSTDDDPDDIKPDKSQDWEPPPGWCWSCWFAKPDTCDQHS